MTHIILLLYLLSGFSGLGTLIYIVMKYGGSSPFMKGYKRVHLSYTLLMLAALVILYLRVNVIRSPNVMSLFISVILLGMGFLSWSLARFSFVINSEGVTKRIRLFWNLFPFSFPILAAGQLMLTGRSTSLAPVILGVLSFIAISLYFSRRNSKSPDPYGKIHNRIWIYFLFFTLLVIGTELILKWKYGFLGEYTINIPLIFLAWNFLSLIQFGKTMDPKKTEGIPRDLAEKWQLTSRELQIALAIRRGDSNKEIAAYMKISASTVKNHIYNIYRKTGVRGRVDLSNLLK